MCTSVSMGYYLKGPARVNWTNGRFGKFKFATHARNRLIISPIMPRSCTGSAATSHTAFSTHHRPGMPALGRIQWQTVKDAVLSFGRILHLADWKYIVVVLTLPVWSSMRIPTARGTPQVLCAAIVEQCGVPILLYVTLGALSQAISVEAEGEIRAIWPASGVV